jgi:chorismate-pyruvate lyase
METIDLLTTQRVPEPLWRFVTESCGFPAEALRMLPGSQLPEPARQLLVHHRDMTSTLASFHGSALGVEVLQQQEFEDMYLREVFLRTTEADRVVEYGIIAVALGPFSGPQRQRIRSGRTPLGGLLHEFRIPFESHPISFFSATTEALAGTRRQALNGAVCFGRFNRLARRGGEPLAWIMEILPAP